MSSNRCARCGRERPLGIVLPPQGGPEGSWAWFDGQDVCPDCQEPEERLQVDQRVIEFIEREIARRQSHGIPPDDLEPPLVNKAMDARQRSQDRAETTHVSSQTTAAHHADGLRLQVAVTGAFLTGSPLVVRLDSYDSLQRSLQKLLRYPNWQLHDLRAAGGTYETAGGGGFTEAMPLVIARRAGDDFRSKLTLAIADSKLGEAPHVAALLTATVGRIWIDVYDLGVAVLTAELHVTAAASASRPTVAAAVKRLAWLDPKERSPLAAVLQDVAIAVAQEYREAVASAAPRELQAAWLSGARVPSASNESGRPTDQTRLLWLHPVQVLRTTDHAQRAAEELTPVFRKTIEVEGGVFAAAIGASAVVVSPDTADTTRPALLTQLHWAYYALYMEIDRGLLHVLSQQRWKVAAPLKELESDASDVFADYLRVMDARTRLDTELSGLGGDDLAIWQTISEVQRFGAVVDGVDRKLDVLEKVAHRRVTQATADRASRITNIVGFLTVLTVVTLAGGVIGVLFGSVSPGTGTLWQRLGAIVGAFALASALYWLAFVRTARTASGYPAQRRK